MVPIKKHRIRLFVGFVLIEVLLTGFFLLLPKTPVVITSYCFALLAPVALLLTFMELTTANKRNYITKVVFFPQALTYLLCNWGLGLIFSFLDIFDIFRLHVGLLLLIHAVFLAVFIWWCYVTLDAGREQIDELGERVAAKTTNWQMIRLDVENFKSYAPADCHKSLQDVIDDLRYADPMSCNEVAAIDEAIKQNVAMMGVKLNAQLFGEIAELCQTIRHQIKDRNNRMKLLK